MALNWRVDLQLDFLELFDIPFQAKPYRGVQSPGALKSLLA